MSTTLLLELDLSSSCLSCSSVQANIPVSAITAYVNLSRLIKGGRCGPRSAKGSAIGSGCTLEALSGALSGIGATISESGCRCTCCQPCKRLLNQLCTLQTMLMMFLAPSPLPGDIAPYSVFELFNLLHPAVFCQESPLPEVVRVGNNPYSSLYKNAASVFKITWVMTLIINVANRSPQCSALHQKTIREKEFKLTKFENSRPVLSKPVHRSYQHDAILRQSWRFVAIYLSQDMTHSFDTHRIDEQRRR